jgi:hypothetical protein
MAKEAQACGLSLAGQTPSVAQNQAPVRNLMGPIKPPERQYFTSVQFLAIQPRDAPTKARLSS